MDLLIKGNEVNGKYSLSTCRLISDTLLRNGLSNVLLIDYFFNSVANCRKDEINRRTGL